MGRLVEGENAKEAESLGSRKRSSAEVGLDGDNDANLDDSASSPFKLVEKTGREVW